MKAINTILMLLAPSMLLAQNPAGEKLSGIWEPVSYPADLILNDVFFINPDIGWVTGGNSGSRGGGVLLHTRDGGANWSAQLGDPESAEPPFTNLHFLDERHGWVLQKAEFGKDKLLRTSDAENWDQAGSIETQWGMLGYTFTSPTNGVYLDGNDNVARIMHSSDGGRTWTEVHKCPDMPLQIDGLTKTVSCTLKSLHFPSANVGYAVGGAHGAKRTLFVAKTEDGGRTWKTSAVPDIGGDLEVYFEQEVYFTDEKTGFVHLSDNKLYRTTDGGETWKGLVATPGPELEFADAQVGWSFFSYKSLSYTTDGGKRWTSREFDFPARVTAFSLPRRDRAYVVGEHGMIYRYRVVPAAAAPTGNALPAPAMPVFDSPLDEHVDELDGIVDALGSAVASSSDTAAAQDESEDAAGPVETEPSEPGEEAEVEEVEVEDVSEPTAFVAGCCAKPLGKLDLVLAAVTGIVPQFLGQYKNTNLLLAGLRMLTDLPARVNELNRSLRAFRKAPDKAAAQAALAQVTAALQGLSQSTNVAYQKQLPPSEEESTAVESGAVAGAETTEPEAGVAEEMDTSPADEAATPAETAEEAETEIQE